jgi:predicted PurR-regulated permease PerM
MPEKELHHMNFNVSILTLTKIAGFILALWFLYVIKDILVIIFVAILLAMAFDPFVSFLQKKKIPRTFGIVILIGCIFLVLATAVALIIPPLLEQMSQITKNFPLYWDKLSNSFVDLQARPETQGVVQNIQNALRGFQSTIGQSAQGVLPFIGTIFGSVISFILISVLTFYFLSQEDAIKKGFHHVTPPRYRPYFTGLIVRMQDRLVLWLRGELLLGLIIGLMAMLGLWLLGVKFFLVLALIAGISELIPYVGPVLGAVPAAFFGFTDSLWKGIAVIILFWLIQQLENHLIVPKVMQKAVGLNPIVVIIVILIGAKILGFLGVVLAVPTAAALSVLVKDFFESNNFGKEISTKDA